MAMRDITDLMNAYRECSRNLWNVYFSAKQDIGGSLDIFSQIQPLLFEALVANELEYDEDADFENLPPPVLRVVPRPRAQILIRRPSDDRNRYWDAVRDMVVSPDEIELEFREYFDWSQAPIREFHFYLCGILNYPSHAEFEGREALIEALSGRVFHDEGK
jgi:hypothetical protein